jgi:hypothetical protein
MAMYITTFLSCAFEAAFGRATVGLPIAEFF